MRRAFPKSSISLAFADLFSLFANLLIFRSLYLTWDLKSYSDWEWLSVWLGICLLIPRNGLEIVALRAAIRHPLHLREWTAIVLVIRSILGCCASLIFFVTSLSMKPAESSLILPLALTLVASSLSPDMAPRAQFRFAKSSLIIMSRNVLFLFFLKLYGIISELPCMAGWALFSAEVGLLVFWCIDAWLNHAFPGGRWMTLIRRAWRPILFSSVEQSITRWIRVFSWSCDALILGMIAPAIWQEVAPARRFLMTGVIPVAGWIGTLGPLLTRQSVLEVQILFQKGLLMVMSVTVVSATVACLFGAEIIGSVFGLDNEVGIHSDILALNALRLAPIVIVMLSGACLTAIKADRMVSLPGLIHLTGLFVGSISIAFFQQSGFVFGMMICIEYVSALIGVTIVLQVIGKKKSNGIERIDLRNQSLRVDTGSLPAGSAKILAVMDGSKDEKWIGVVR
jgi:hypothetical protein